MEVLNGSVKVGQSIAIIGAGKIFDWFPFELHTPDISVSIGGIGFDVAEYVTQAEASTR